MSKKEKAEISGTKKVARKLTDFLELPKEVVMNLPLISLVGKEEMTIENYKGVVEYSEERIRINTAAGVLKIEGRRLQIMQITAENIGITGGILRIEFLS